VYKVEDNQEKQVKLYFSRKWKVVEEYFVEG
jgi:hypothetical protein